MKIHHIFQVFSIVSASIESEIPKFDCQSLTSRNCTVASVYLDPHQTEFLPVSDVPAQVILLETKVSSIPTFSAKGICFVFPWIRILNLEEQRTTVLDKDAFESCYNVESVFLGRNYIKELDEQLFVPLRSLKTLSLDGNQLRQVSGTALAPLTQLGSLQLQSNPILDLDVQKIIYDLKSLQEIWLQDTDIPCVRMERILERFHTANIIVRNETRAKRNRGYEPAVINGFICVADQ